MAELTPMKRQYYEIKQKHTDCLLFFRLGDFYEMFDEDAKIASRELELALTTRDRGKPEEEQTPMCGVPYHSAEAYIARLIAKGYKVAICEQMEDPALAKGLVDRDIIRIITPGTVTETSMLEEGKSNYICALYLDAASAGAAFCDVSTGEFCVSAFSGADSAGHLVNELGRFSPREAVLSPGAAEDGAVTDFLTKKLAAMPEYDVDGFEFLAAAAGFVGSLVLRTWTRWAWGTPLPLCALRAHCSGISPTHRNVISAILTTLTSPAVGGIWSWTGPHAAIWSSPNPCARAKSGEACCGCWIRPKPPWADGCCAPGWRGRFCPLWPSNVGLPP